MGCPVSANEAQNGHWRSVNSRITCCASAGPRACAGAPKVSAGTACGSNLIDTARGSPSETVTYIRYSWTWTATSPWSTISADRLRKKSVTGAAMSGP